MAKSIPSELGGGPGSKESFIMLFPSYVKNDKGKKQIRLESIPDHHMQTTGIIQKYKKRKGTVGIEPTIF